TSLAMTDLSLAKLVDSVQQAVIAVDLDGNITHWNAYAEELYGWKGREVIGRHITILSAPSNAKRGEEILDTLLQGATWAGTFTKKHRNDDEVEVYVIVAPVVRGGKLVGSLGVSVPRSSESRGRLRIKALTAREREVLRLTAEAKRSSEVATVLGLS